MKARLLIAAIVLIAAQAQAAPASCPNAGAQLTEYLAAAKQREARDGSVTVTFTVDRAGKAKVTNATGTAAYIPWVHNAVDSLECVKGDAPATLTVLIRFTAASVEAR